MSVTVLLKDACSTIGEGPHWEESTQSLLFVDLMLGDLHRYNTLTGTDSKLTLEGTAGFYLPRASEGYVVGLNRTLCTLHWDQGVATPIAEVDLGCDTKINDAKCDASGRLWAGTMSAAFKDGKFTPEQGALYSLAADHILQKHVSRVGISNGLAWSRDNTIMYYIDSIPKHLYVFDYDIADGSIRNQRVAVDFGKFEADIGLPDGMCVDQEGKLWVACFDGARVVRLDPGTGKILRTIEFPAKKITSCCFGGRNYDELYVTSARWSSTPEELARYPLAGSVFKVTGLGVTGALAPSYAG